VRNITPELELLFRLLRGQEPTGKKLDGDKFFRMVKFHHLTELVAEKIANSALEFLDDKTRTLFFAESKAVAIFQRKLLQEFPKVVNLFSEKGIPFILLKGLYLTDTIYPEKENRQFADYDILILPKDLALCEEAILQADFTKTDSFYNRLNIRDCAVTGAPRTYFHTRARYLQIDLHTQVVIAPGYRFLASDYIWSSTKTQEIHGFKIQTLSLEATLAHLCWHALKHTFARLIWYRDIWFFYKKHDFIFNEPLFTNLVSEYRLSRIVATALNLTARIFDDEQLAVKAKHFYLTKLSDSVYFSDVKLFYPRRDISAKTRIYRDLSLLQGVRDKVRYIFHALLPTPKMIPGFSGKKISRWHLRYLIFRFRTLFSAFKDQEIFKT
jgi:hypothetical protein